MSANGKKILIVEDEAVAADNLREFLEENGYTVLDVCNSGEDAVNKATKNLPDLVLMDIKLQGDMDGVEAAIRINKKSRVPIIYLTAFGDDEKVARAKAIEPPVFIPKPYSLNDVLNIIGAFEYEKEMDDALNLAKKAREVVLLAEKKVTEAQIKAGKAKRKLQFFTHTTKEEEAASGPKCFIVHGHDDKAKLDLKNYLQNTLKFPEPLVLHELPSIGKNIIEKFEDYAKDVDLVFVLLTPDDKGCSKKTKDNEKKRRARQNVIFEMGYFFGQFSPERGRVILLHKGPIELPSDINGLITIKFSDKIAAVGEDIRKEIKDFLPG